MAQKILDLSLFFFLVFAGACADSTDISENHAPAPGGTNVNRNDAGPQPGPLLQDGGAPDVKADAGLPTYLDAGHTETADAGFESPVACGGCARSALYPEDWTPGTTHEDGFFLHDFSYAGYRNSERSIPDLADADVFTVTDYGADATGTSDSSAAIQAAIDAAALNGGGVIALPAGTYRCDSNLSIASSNTVLRGNGPESTQIYFTRNNASDDSSIRFSGGLLEGTDRPLLENGVSRAHEVLIGEHDLEIGDDVLLGWSISDPFIQEHNMGDYWNSGNNFPSVNLWRPFFRRVVVGLEPEGGNTRVLFDVPLRYPMKVRDAASLRKVTGHLEEVGLEHLKLSNAVEANQAWAANRVHLVEMNQVKNSWVQNIRSGPSPVGVGAFHLQSSGILIKASKNVTVTDAVLKNAQNRGSGGNGYLFEVMQSNEILFADSKGVAGRHNFVQNWDFGTSGVVFLRTESSEGQTVNSADLGVGVTAYSEFHHALAMANLIDDSFASDGWAAVNRRNYSSGAGTCATQTVFWNLRGEPGLGGLNNNALLSYQHGTGYVIGTQHMDVQTEIPFIDLTGRSLYSAPDDYVELVDEGHLLEPSSLFEDQLARRLQQQP